MCAYDSNQQGPARHGEALKILSEASAGNAELQARFEREGRKASV